MELTLSQIAGTQIAKPADEQAFERGSRVLWQCLLGDRNVQRHGRRGQRQNGVDLYGVQDGDVEHYVGIQCKLKGPDKGLTETEVRHEVSEALTFEPELREFFITTTAPDDKAMQALARRITSELKNAGKQMRVYVWGWNTLEERIAEHAAARRAFDPGYEPIIAEQVTKLQELLVEAGSARLAVPGPLAIVQSAPSTPLPGDAADGDAVEALLDAQVDDLRALLQDGKPRTAQHMLEQLLARLPPSASGRLKFRVKANIGACRFHLGDDQGAVRWLEEAVAAAPAEPKAVANKAFALLIQDRWAEVLELGRIHLANDPTNEGLAGYVVQAARHDPAVDDPLQLIPEALWSTPAVMIGRIVFLRQRAPDGVWWSLAKEALEAHPENSGLRLQLAEAELERIVSDDQFQRTHLLGPGDPATLERATGVLRAEWDRIKDSEGALKPEHLAICANLMVGYQVLHRLPEALELAREGMARGGADPYLAARAARVALEAGDDDLLDQVLALLPTGPDATVIELERLSALDDWKGLADLYHERADHVPDAERPLLEALGQLAEIALSGGVDDLEDRLRKTVRAPTPDPRTLAVVAGFATRNGLEALGDELFAAAVGSITDRSHIAARVTVAMHAAERRDWSIVADLLVGHLPLDQDTYVLRTLARALVNDQPIKRRAAAFFKALPVQIREIQHYTHAEGLMNVGQGALGRGETLLRKALEAGPTARIFLDLCLTLRRRDRAAAIKDLFARFDIETLSGSPSSRMHLAHELSAAEYEERALALGYTTLRQHPNDPDVALKYVGLLMLNPRTRPIPEAEIVVPDCWVMLAGPSGDRRSFVIEQGPDRPAEGFVSPTHPMAVLALGLRRGESFEMISAIGAREEWRVEDIKHKYLHALHDVMEHYETRFPDKSGLYRMRIEDGDITPALEQVRRTSERNRALADFYLVQRIPMAIVASHLAHDQVGFAEYIRSLDRDIVACVGTAGERAAAMARIEALRETGAVLDTYAAWTAATMGVLGPLRSTFSRLLIAQSTLDELRGLREQHPPHDQATFGIAWRDGQFNRREITPEDTERVRSLITEQIEAIEAACDVEPVEAPDAPPEIAATLTDTFGVGILDPVYLAAAGGRLLISEDRFYREIALSSLGVPGAWLQATLMAARSAGLLSTPEYCQAVVGLAARHHGHLALQVDVLLHAWDAAIQGDLGPTSAVARYLGNENADFRSHLAVLSEFLGRSWALRRDVDARLQAMTGILLRHLLRNEAHRYYLLAVLRSAAGPALVDYIDAFVRGHFLSFGELAQAARDISAHRLRDDIDAILHDSPRILQCDWLIPRPDARR